MRREGVLILALALLCGCDGGEAETGGTARVRIKPAPAAPAAGEGAGPQQGAGGPAAPSAAASRTCAPIRFKAGASSAVVAGGAGAGTQGPRAGEADCYKLAVGEGQRAEVRLLPGSGPDVAVTIAGVGEAQDRFAFTTRRGTYEILVFQTRRDRPPQPYRLSVAVSALKAGGAGAAAPAGSCGAELGATAAAALVRQCVRVSPATHPPCHADNPCAMIRDEIARGCAQLSPADRPDFCGGDRARAAPAAEDAAWVVGTWASTDRGCQGEDMAVTYFASGNYAAHGEVGRWKLAGERLSWTATEATGEVPAGEVAVGRTVSASVTRLGADEMALQTSDGGRTRLRRCP